MRRSEWLHIVVFLFFAVLACLRELRPGKRRKVILIAALGVSSTLLAAYVIPSFVQALTASVIRDWLPAVLILVVYWQAGAFFVRVNQRAQARLQQIDRIVVPPLNRWLARKPAGAWIAMYLEISYLFCYAMVPGSLAALYVLRLGEHADYFWTVVLTASYASYAALPFVQTMPPRSSAEPWLQPLHLSPIRRFNLWILSHASIQANTFPSAHVAASAACALVLATLAPLPVAVVFICLAVGIAVGTFLGRYHFAADAIAGAAVAIIAFLIVRSH